MVRCTPRYVVIDTNVFIDYLPPVQKLVRKQAFNPIVPLKSGRELDNLPKPTGGVVLTQAVSFRLKRRAYYGRHNFFAGSDVNTFTLCYYSITLASWSWLD